MKRTIVSFIFFSLCMFVFGQTSYLEGVSISNSCIEKTDNRDVRVRMNLGFSGLDIKRQESLVIIPVIVSQDGKSEQELPSVILNGKVRDKVNSRIESLSDSLIYPHDATVMRRNNGTVQSLDYDASVPFQKWMIGGQLYLHGFVVGCAACEGGYETMALGNILPPFVPEYHAGFIVPEREIVKRRSESLNARIQFRQGSHVIDPQYSTNRAELDSVTKSLNYLVNNDDIDITGIYVTGYASPEGGYNYNMKLSENRVKSFAGYIKTALKGVDPSGFHVDWKGEDWECFRAEYVDFPYSQNKEEILDIIDNCTGDKDLCEKQIRALLPKDIYERLLNEVYPKVRRNEVRIEYQVHHFSIEEGREMLYKDPKLMSISEIHEVAESYGKGTPEYVSAMLAGVSGYGQDVVMLNNAALALIGAGRPGEAVSLLEGSQDDARLLNIMGKAYIDMNNNEAAIRCFEKSSSMGCDEAENNLLTLRKYLEYISEY